MFIYIYIYIKLISVYGLTKADKDPLESLVAGGLQVKQGEFIVCAVLGFMADGLKQCRCSVELRMNNSQILGKTYPSVQIFDA